MIFSILVLNLFVEFGSGRYLVILFSIIHKAVTLQILGNLAVAPFHTTGLFLDPLENVRKPKNF